MLLVHNQGSQSNTAATAKITLTAADQTDKRVPRSSISVETNPDAGGAQLRQAGAIGAAGPDLRGGSAQKRKVRLTVAKSRRNIALLNSLLRAPQVKVTMP